jgi:hypothetical protein
LKEFLENCNFFTTCCNAMDCNNEKRGVAARVKKKEVLTTKSVCRSHKLPEKTILTI